MSVIERTATHKMMLSGLKSTKEKQGAKVSLSLRQEHDEADKAEQRKGRETLI